MVSSKKLYIIAGCNGAGKTTASFNILPDLLDCKEFVNADEIARGLSPFQPEKVSFEAGRIMLVRIKELQMQGETFAFETTLATKSFKSFIALAKGSGYSVSLLYFWLPSVDLAKNRVSLRVLEGGHDIPVEVIERRYFAGIRNLFNIYHNHCDVIHIIDNSIGRGELIYTKDEMGNITTFNLEKINHLKSQL